MESMDSWTFRFSFSSPNKDFNVETNVLSSSGSASSGTASMRPWIVSQEGTFRFLDAYAGKLEFDAIVVW